MTDGPMHPRSRPTLVFGARGITTAQIMVYGADRPLHSGHYGNWAPNPAMRLAKLLASMKDDEGRVLVEGWYDDVSPLSAEERAAIAGIEDESPADYGFLEPEGGPGARRLERIALPSLNVRGLQSGWVGADARTLVPDSAVAELDLRLVPRVDPDEQVRRLVAHVRAQGYHVVSEAPDSAARASHPRIARVTYPEGGYPAARTSFDHPVARRMTEALTRAFPEPPIRMPTMGGSVPASWFPVITGTETLLLPLVNMDNNQHAENENLRLGVSLFLLLLPLYSESASESGAVEASSTTGGGGWCVCVCCRRWTPARPLSVTFWNSCSTILAPPPARPSPSLLPPSARPPPPPPRRPLLPHPTMTTRQSYYASYHRYAIATCSLPGGPAPAADRCDDAVKPQAWGVARGSPSQ